jgi:O-antigen ligase
VAAAVACLGFAHGPSMIATKVARIALYAFILAVPLDVRAIDGMGSGTAALGVLLAAVTVAAVAARGYVRKAHAIHYLLIALAAWVAVSNLWSFDPDVTLPRTLTIAQLVVFAWVYWQLGNTPRFTESAITAFVSGALIVVVDTFVNFARGETYSLDARFAAKGYDPNDLGVTLAIAMPLAWYLVVRCEGWRRLLGGLYVPAALAAVALTASRGATLTVLVAILAVPALTDHLGGRTIVRAVAVGFLAAAVLYVWIPSASWERLLSTRDELSGGTLSYRTVVWRAAWETFGEHWLCGVGAGAFPAVAASSSINERMVVHNTFLSIAVELGSIGVALYFAPWVLVGRRARRAEKVMRRWSYVVLTTWVIGVSSLTWEYRKTTWFLLALLLQAPLTLREDDECDGFRGDGDRAGSRRDRRALG